MFVTGEGDFGHLRTDPARELEALFLEEGEEKGVGGFLDGVFELGVLSVEGIERAHGRSSK